MALRVSREEYEREVEELNRLKAELNRLMPEYNAKWIRLRRTVANIRRNQRRLTELQTRLETLKATGWARLKAAERLEWIRIRDTLIPETRRRIDYWTAERERVIAEIYRELPSIRRLEEAIRTEEARIRLKILPPIIAVVDSKTGYLIQYLEKEYRGRRCWLYDEEEDKYIKPVSTIRVEYTASVETGGHESFIGELTGYTIIEDNELPEINYIVDELVAKTEDWFYRKFAPPPAGEAAFGGPIPKEAIRPDFTIQERERGAKHEDTIIDYYMAVTGEWLSRKIMKKGIGFYANPDETWPKWTRVAVYVEYAHEDETLGVDHKPIMEEIDP